MRVRTLKGAWRWALIVLTGLTIFLCINQQFALRFFVGFTPLNTEYFYLLILCMLPFTFLIFPGSEKASLDADALVRRACCSSPPRRRPFYLMINIRKAAELGWEFGGAPAPDRLDRLRHVGRADGGAAPHRRLEPAAQRRSPSPSIPLFAGADWLGPLQGHPVDARPDAPPITCCRPRACSASRSRPSPTSVIGFLVFGTALMMTGAGKFFINLAFALCGTFRGGAAKVGIFASGLLGMMSGSIVSNVLTAGTMTIPIMKRTGFRASYAGAIEACASTGAVLAPPVMGATAFVMAQFLSMTYAEVALAAIIPAVLYYVGLFMQVDAYAARHGLQGPAARASCRAPGQTLKEGWYYAFVIVAADRHAALLQAREPRAVLCHGAAAGAEPVGAAAASGGRSTRSTCVVAVAATLAHDDARRGPAPRRSPCRRPPRAKRIRRLDERDPAAGAGRHAAADRAERIARREALGLDQVRLRFLEVNGRTFVELIGILAGCGLLIGAFSLTGVISSLANDLLAIAGNNALLLLAMCAITSLILGLGLTTTACYIFLAILVGPALEKARAQQDGRAHVHLLLGHAVVDHAAGRDRLLRRRRHRRRAGDEDRLGIDVGRAASSTSSRSSSSLNPALVLQARRRAIRCPTSRRST